MSSQSHNSWTVLEHTRQRILGPESDPSIGENINGPTVIRVPDWVTNPLGKYYLYFGHHRGQFIRLAYADSPVGPWKVHAPGCLQLSQVPALYDHIASPDVHIDHEHRQIRMYVHGGGGVIWWQETALTFSGDGLNFQAHPGVLAPYYLRAFPWKDRWLGISRDNNEDIALFLESPDGLQPFRRTRPIVPGARHFGLLVEGDILWVFYTRLGDMPERIVVSRVEMKGEPETWEFEDGTDLMRPELDWEGKNFPLTRSRGGPKIGVRELRDPFVRKDDGRYFLYYSGAGESCLGMVEITPA